MAEQSTWIKVDRNILRWGWFQDSHTVHLFLYLLLKANIEDCKFQNIVVHRGQVVIGRKALAAELGLSERNVRTALNHLQMTGEVTSKAYPKFSVITIVSYDKYQCNRPASDQLNDQQTTSNRPATDHNQRIKEQKKKRIQKCFVAPTLQQVKDYAKQINSPVDPEYFFYKMDSVGWILKNGQEVKNWKSTMRTWEKYETPKPVQQQIQFNEFGKPMRQRE